MNSAIPMHTAARLVTSTGRWLNIRGETSGSAVRRSRTSQPANSATASTRAPRVRTDTQPQVRPCESGSSSSTRLAPSTSPPSQSIRPPAAGRRGTTTRVSTRAASVTPSASAKMRW